MANSRERGMVAVAICAWQAKMVKRGKWQMAGGRWQMADGVEWAAGGMMARQMARRKRGGGVDVARIKGEQRRKRRVMMSTGL